jgi:ketohexokinase
VQAVNSIMGWFVANILGVGIATLDIINSVTEYPDEDAEVRAVQQRICRGGNVTNTLSVLSQLGHKCSWAGVYVEDASMKLIQSELHAGRIDMRWCRCEVSGAMPVSYITLNMGNGSRTIVHYRDLPEFDFEDFCKIPLADFGWIHFEGRNVDATRKMLEHVRRTCPELTISLEVEKHREQIEQLFPFADLCLFSKRYVESHGYSEAGSFLASLAKELPGCELVCAWGEEGAYAMDREGVYTSQPAFVPTQVVDTLAAGDVFNAALIHARHGGEQLSGALRYACELAGQKCARPGIHALLEDC